MFELSEGSGVFAAPATALEKLCHLPGFGGRDIDLDKRLLYLIE